MYKHSCPCLMRVNDDAHKVLNVDIYGEVFIIEDFNHD